METFQLFYASSAVGQLSFAAVTSIAKESSDRNLKCGITGMLCYSAAEGEFLQALEGERGAVNRVYGRIARDGRHAQCELLECGAVTCRSFPEWSMKMIGWELAPSKKIGWQIARSKRRQAMLERHIGSADFHPTRWSGTQARAFLNELANLERVENVA